jgi:hypothetical protein
MKCRFPGQKIYAIKAVSQSAATGTDEQRVNATVWSNCQLSDRIDDAGSVAAKKPHRAVAVGQPWETLACLFLYFSPSENASNQNR